MAAAGAPATGATAASYSVNEEGWPLSPDGYILEQEIGQGAFATVIKAKCVSKDVHVAVKIMALENLTTSMEEIQAEVRAMKLSRHENILDLHCAFVVKTALWLVMPLMDKGSCFYALRLMRKSGRIPEGAGFDEETIATILKELVNGLDYIHGQHQIHRDIKAGNVLLASDGRVAIADFGVAGWLLDIAARGGEGECKTFVGTPCWMAPEVMEQRGYNQKADIWSVGITALELARGYAPYSKLAPMQVLLKTIREPPPSLESYGAPPPGAPALSKHFRDFLSRCLQKDPRMRPSAHELRVHVFFKKAKSAKWLADTLLREVPEVGSAEAMRFEPEARPKGYDALKINLTKGASLVPGTTWVFPDEAPEARPAPDAGITVDELAAMIGDEELSAEPGAAAATAAARADGGL